MKHDEIGKGLEKNIYYKLLMSCNQVQSKELKALRQFPSHEA